MHVCELGVYVFLCCSSSGQPEHPGPPSWLLCAAASRSAGTSSAPRPGPYGRRPRPRQKLVEPAAAAAAPSTAAAAKQQA